MGAREHIGTQDTLYYDGRCGLCRRSMRIIRALDWFGALAYQDSTAVDEAELPVAFEVAMEGIPMRTRDGKVLVGFPAVRRALRQTALGCLPAMLMYVPGVSHVGAHMYGIIAKNRRRDMACEFEQGS